MNLCKGKHEVFGKIKNYEVDGNKVIIKYENIDAIISIISDDIINFFVPLFRKDRISKAVENIELLKDDELNFDIKEFEGKIQITTN